MAENQHSALLCTMRQTVREWSVGGFDLFQIYIYNEKRPKLAKFKRLRQELAEMVSQREGKQIMWGTSYPGITSKPKVNFTTPQGRKC